MMIANEVIGNFVGSALRTNGFGIDEMTQGAWRRRTAALQPDPVEGVAPATPGLGLRFRSSPPVIQHHFVPACITLGRTKLRPDAAAQERLQAAGAVVDV